MSAHPQPALTNPSTALSPVRTLAIGASALVFVFCLMSLQPLAITIGGALLAISIWAPSIVGRIVWAGIVLFFGGQLMLFGSLPGTLLTIALLVLTLVPKRDLGHHRRWQRRADVIARAEAPAQPGSLTIAGAEGRGEVSLADAD